MSNSGPNPEKDLSRSNGLNYAHLSMAFSNVQRFALGLLWLPLVGGCATQNDEQNKQLREATERLVRIQSTTDRLEERVAALEAVQRAQTIRQTNKGIPATVPTDLPVVKMSPPSPSATNNDVSNASTETDEPRTLIVGEGSRVEARSAQDLPSSPSGKRGKDKPATEPPAKKTRGATETGK